MGQNNQAPQARLKGVIIGKWGAAGAPEAKLKGKSRRHGGVIFVIFGNKKMISKYRPKQKNETKLCFFVKQKTKKCFDFQNKNKKITKLC